MRGDGEGFDGARHRCRDPRLASATVMRVTAPRIQTKLNRIDRSAYLAERHLNELKLSPPLDLSRAKRRGCAMPSAARSEKHLISRPRRAIVDVNRQVVWGMSAEVWAANWNRRVVKNYRCNVSERKTNAGISKNPVLGVVPGGMGP